MIERDKTHENAILARTILAIGLVFYISMCIPLYTRRGYPEVDPFWLSMQWGWVPSVIFSSMLSRVSGVRMVELLFFSLVLSISISWINITNIPSNRTFLKAVSEAPLYIPKVILYVGLAELISRCLWHGVRNFIPKPYCRNCQYPIKGLQSNACPECGVELFPEISSNLRKLKVSPLCKRKSIAIAAVFVVLFFLFPFFYSYNIRMEYRQSGERQAVKDWAAKAPVWYVFPDEFSSMLPEQKSKCILIESSGEQYLGFSIRFVPEVQGWEKQEWVVGYRGSIDALLRKNRREYPNFDVIPENSKN